MKMELKKKKKKYKISPEERERRRQRMLGNSIHKGYKLSDESKKIISEKATGRKKTKKECLAISKRMKGNQIRKGKRYSHTIETRIKISNALSKKTKSWYNVKIEIPEYLIPNPKIFSEIFR